MSERFDGWKDEPPIDRKQEIWLSVALLFFAAIVVAATPPDPTAGWLVFMWLILGGAIIDFAIVVSRRWR